MSKNYTGGDALSFIRFTIRSLFCVITQFLSHFECALLQLIFSSYVYYPYHYPYFKVDLNFSAQFQTIFTAIEAYFDTGAIHSR